MSDWMIYGATGYTGELIAREAARRGLRPILAGRSLEKIGVLAAELKLEARVFPIDDSARIATVLSDIAIVLHCAGPFVRTSRPMVDACLTAGTHYLDITGEIAVFEDIMSRTSEARAKGAVLCPGVGFDVVPTDCLAAMLHERLPDANDLQLAFYSKGAELSRGTMKTMLEGIGEGGAIRRDGKIVRVPMVYDVREIPFSAGPRMAMTIPWGDVSTAFHTTGIPNIRVYNASSPKSIRRMRMLAPFFPLLALPPIKRVLQSIAGRRTGPGEEKRAQGRTFLWGEVKNSSGQSASMRMTTPEGYAFTVLSAVAAVEWLLSHDPAGGSYTPARLFGARFAEAIPGVKLDAS